MGYQSRRVPSGGWVGAARRCPLPTRFTVTIRDLAGQEKNKLGAHSPAASSGQADPTRQTLAALRLPLRAPLAGTGVCQ